MENEEKKTKQVKKSTTSTKKKTTSTAKKSTTTKKKTTTTAKKKTTAAKKTTPKKEIEQLPVTLEKPIEVKEETIEDIDIVFQTRKIPQQMEQIEEPRQATVRIPREEDDEPPKKKKKKFRLTPVGILTIVILFIIIDALFIFFVVTTSNKKKKKKEAETINAIKKEEEKEEEKPKEKEPVKVTDPNQEKLDKLDNINTKLDFFKNENIDRYLAYKEKNPDMDLEKVIVYVNIGLDNEFYTNIKNSPYTGTNTVITNKYYKLDSNYEPKGLTEINSAYSSGSRKMVKDATNAFNELAAAAKKEGYTIRAVSTYRSFSYQKDLYSRYANNDGVKKADTYSARAGHSEHQTGLAVDVDNNREVYTSFGNTKEFTWMKNNAYKYGFILRYTKENEWITGYKDEPWHYRYVGKDIAKYIQENPMTYEEYFVRFLDK